MSITDACARWGLDPRLPPALAANNIHHFFPVQAHVLPYLLPPSIPSSSSSSFLLPGRDAVICAPTGSGKTLVYVLTLLQALSSRRVGRLRGLVVVPTRDLAMQVRPPSLPPSLLSLVGSGKTLVYVLTLLKALSTRRVGRLRGLVVRRVIWRCR